MFYLNNCRSGFNKCKNAKEQKVTLEKSSKRIKNKKYGLKKCLSIWNVLTGGVGCGVLKEGNLLVIWIKCFWKSLM